MRFTVLALIMVCATLATVRGEEAKKEEAETVKLDWEEAKKKEDEPKKSRFPESFPWFEAKNEEECFNDPDNHPQLNTEGKPQPKHCREEGRKEGDEFCFCAKLGNTETGWEHKCAICHK